MAQTERNIAFAVYRKTPADFWHAVVKSAGTQF